MMRMRLLRTSRSDGSDMEIHGRRLDLSDGFLILAKSVLEKAYSKASLRRPEGRSFML